MKSQNPSAALYGIDICSTAVDHCIQKGINAKTGNAEEIPFEDNYFDIALMSLVIEHVINQDNALAEAHRILKKGGRFLLTTDNIWWQWIMKAKNILMPWKPKYVRFQQPIDDEFTYRRIRKMLEKAGFRITKRMKSGPIAIGGKYLGRFDWSICLYKRHWLLCEKV